MTVDVQLGQRADVDPVFLAVIHLRRQFPVQRVDSFDDDQLVLLNGSQPLAKDLLPLQKVESGQVYSLPCQQTVQVMVEQLDIDGAKILVIRFTILVQWCLAPLHEIVICSHVHWVKTIDPELDAKPLSKSGFS